MIRNFSAADTEPTPGTPNAKSPNLKSPRRKSMQPKEKNDAPSPGAQEFKAPSSPPGSPYRIALSKREAEPAERKLPRSLSSPRSSGKIRPASQPTSPRELAGTTTTTTTSTSTSTATDSRLASPATPLEKIPSGSPTRIRTESSPGRIQSPEQIKRMLETAMAARRTESKHVLAEVKKIQPPPYPTAAIDWIDAKSFYQLPHAAKVMVNGFAAVKHLYEKGQETFGDKWSFKSGEEEPMRNWAQRGLTKRENENNVEYFRGQKAFEDAYLKGGLQEHFDSAMKEVEKLAPGKQRDARLLLLAKQGDHVLNLALESLRAVTFRDLSEVRPEQLKAVRDAMTADQPSQFELGVLLAYFGEANCIAVQAFLNAFLWQAETARKFVHPQASLKGMLNTFHFVGPHLLGYPFNDLQLVMAKSMTDEFRRNLKRAGLDDKQLALLLNMFKKKRIAELDLAKAAQKVERHEVEEQQTTFNLLYGKWLELLHKLAQGDQRFMFACGLSITDALPATAQALSSPKSAPALSPQALSPQAQAPKPAPTSPAVNKANEEEESGSFLEQDQ